MRYKSIENTNVVRVINFQYIIISPLCLFAVVVFLLFVPFDVYGLCQYGIYEYTNEEGDMKREKKGTHASTFQMTVNQTCIKYW